MVISDFFPLLLHKILDNKTKNGKKEEGKSQ